MADLAKYEAVDHLFSGTHAAEELVSKMLREGWELISVKIVEEQYRVEFPDKSRDFIKKDAGVHYVLGRRRDHKSPEQKERARKAREDAL